MAVPGVVTKGSSNWAVDAHRTGFRTTQLDGCWLLEHRIVDGVGGRAEGKVKGGGGGQRGGEKKEICVAASEWVALLCHLRRLRQSNGYRED